MGLIVGIGASAGGLSAFTSFFANMPTDGGMAFVLVQHLAPDHRSMLADILGKVTAMKVVEAEDGMPVAANAVYVIPPNATLTFKAGRLRVSRPAPPREHRRPIDTFFFSLAQDQGENAVCIILAGTGSDGTLGLKAIKENGGLTLAQAEYDHMAMSGMPHSAAATGLVDAVMAVEDMPAKLLSYKGHLLVVAPVKGEDGTRQDMAAHLKTISKLLHTRIGHDFSMYKENTLIRRIQRRMQVLQIDKVPAYITLLKKEPDQLELLFREFLIGVTHFFRDPQAFEALERIAIPKLLEDKGASDAIRIWVPGCSTGEEVYSIAILAKEEAERRGIASRIQIFATDIDDRAVAIARAGRYQKVSGVSEERLNRWFTKDGDEHCPLKEIRELCVFSPHSVVKDPPFSKLDLISCRNMLIYMNADLQDRVLRSFHYALKPNGILFLGPSEGATRLNSAFKTLDKKHRVFERVDAKVILPELSISADRPPRHPSTAAGFSPGEDRIERNARRALEQYSPVYVVVDEQHDIVRFSGGEVGHYLEPSSGTASLNLFGLLRKALRPSVRAAIQTMLTTKRAVVNENVALRIDGKSRAVTVIVTPIAGGFCVVAFQGSRVASMGNAAVTPGVHPNAGTEALEHELRTTKTQLQSTIDELETTAEEMKSAAEEYQSVNEELQSSNEELETAKEEMQSVNEELHTVNAEMTAKNETMTLLNSDLKNLLDSTDIATIFLHNDLRIKSFTSGMTDIFHLRDADRGRPVTEIVTLLNYSELQDDVRKVLRDLAVLEKEVRVGEEGMTFIMRIHPYRTVDNVIDGVVITFVDISERKKAEEHTALLMGELDHRVKNILSIVSAVVKQTLKTSTSPESFMISMEGRVAAISRAHGVLTRNGGQDEALLHDLITTELAPYDRRGNNLEVTGPDIALTPKASLAIAMAVHELCSNAAKYGALSTSSGRLTVRWEIIGGASAWTLKLVWTEAGGPTVAEPTRQGFGTTLIERGLAHEFDATVTREFLALGLRCTIDIPLTAEVGHARLPRERSDA
ncbi:PAS domain-containing protein [Mesorhizobium sp. AR07]|uniref:chemotaxis protein CheB n=1 Tax=Mesorhizobium sp. AR07 TaxID=2865838 RepID=UPI0021609CA4|nr:chemotaxis protein CheB [Mesorhizobium sp. AR07]UVK42002.1 PAS domain-containing protein [Mesorhizobium sp. AR07]